MQIAVRMAGYSMAEADMLRQAMGKKIRAKLMVHREKFIQGCVDNGYPERLGQDLFELMEPFADYGFNASHACAYGYIAYQTAYLKAHHPVEYMSAILTSVRDDKDRKPFYLNACRLMGLEVLPPDVNESEQDFAPVKSGEPKIRYGLSAVRNVGSGAVQQIIEARRAKGSFTGYADYCRKVDPSVLTKKVLESLIYAGAFDSFGYRRRGLVENQDKISVPISAERKAEAAGQFSLFGGGEQAANEIDEGVITSDEFDKRTLLRLEKEVLGQFVTDHPLLGREGAAGGARRHGDRRDRGPGRRRPRHGRGDRRLGLAPLHEEGRALRAVPPRGPGRRRDGGRVPGPVREPAAPARARLDPAREGSRRPPGSRRGAPAPRRRDHRARPRRRRPSEPSERAGW